MRSGGRSNRTGRSRDYRLRLAVPANKPWSGPFAVDAAWESRNGRAELANLVELLRTDLNRNLDRLAVALDEATVSAAGMSQLLRVMDAREVVPGHPLLALLGSPFSGSSFEPVAAAYDAVTNSASWARIPSDVKVALAALVGSASRSDLPSVRTQSYLGASSVAAEYGGLRAFMESGALGWMGTDAEFLTPDPDGLLRDPYFEHWVVTVLVTERRAMDTFRTWPDQLEAI